MNGVKESQVVCNLINKNCITHRSCETGKSFIGCDSIISCQSNQSRTRQMVTRIPLCNSGNVFAVEYATCVPSPVSPATCTATGILDSPDPEYITTLLPDSSSSLGQTLTAVLSPSESQSLEQLCPNPNRCSGATCYVSLQDCYDSDICVEDDNRTVRQCSILFYCFERQGTKVVSSVRNICPPGQLYDGFYGKCAPTITREFWT